nr:retrotransposon Orf1 [Tanacetum cinerariifolium]
MMTEKMRIRKKRTTRKISTSTLLHHLIHRYIHRQKVLKFNSFFESLGLVPSSFNIELICTKEEDGDVMFIEIIPKDDNSRKEEPEAREQEVEYFDIFSTRSELTYHKYLIVLGKPFVEISNMTHDPLEGVVSFTNGNNEVAYKMPHKIEQYVSLSNLEKEHTKLVYLRNEEEKRRRVEYVMSKILGVYKECLELEPDYLTGMDDEGEVTLYLMRRSLEVLRKFYWMILG